MGWTVMRKLRQQIVPLALSLLSRRLRCAILHHPFQFLRSAPRRKALCLSRGSTHQLWRGTSCRGETLWMIWGGEMEIGWYAGSLAVVRPSLSSSAAGLASKSSWGLGDKASGWVLPRIDRRCCARDVYFRYTRLIDCASERSS